MSHKERWGWTRITIQEGAVERVFKGELHLPGQRWGRVGPGLSGRENTNAKTHRHEIA